MPAKSWAKPPGCGIRGQDALQTLEEYIAKEIVDNNCLGLPDAEIQCMAAEVAKSATRASVFDWCTTLMLGEARAAEIIKRRINYDLPFDDDMSATAGDGASTAVPDTSIGAGKTLVASKMTSGDNKKKGRGKRGTTLNHLAKTGNTTGTLRPGRFMCGCFATVHKLRGNCLNCGRLICEQEADDECYFCNLPPDRCLAYEIKAQEGLLSKAALEQNRSSYDESIARRDQLLEYAQQRAKRTVVIDDQAASLFTPQSAWISPQERKDGEKAAAEAERRRQVEAMHKYKGSYQVHLDFENANVALGATETVAGATAMPTREEPVTKVDSDAEAEDEEWASEEVPELRVEPLPTILQKIWYSPDGTQVGKATTTPLKSSTQEDANTRAPVQRYEEVSKRVQQDYFEDDMQVFAEAAQELRDRELVFSSQRVLQPSEGSECDGEKLPSSPPILSGQDAIPKDLAARLQPTAAMRSRDDGVCLSMHQPWASLLVAGIKKHEGRVWETDYRGRLWIHAASAQPVDIEATERHYTPFMSPEQSFPKYYPTKVLLGYVYAVDCLDREGYQKTFAAEQRQEDSPFTIVCTEPKFLPFPLPMSGKNKLFSLDRKVHLAACRQLGECE